MVLKKPSEYFKENKSIDSVDISIQKLETSSEIETFSDAFESFKKNLGKIEVLSDFSETLDNYRLNVEKINYLSEKIESIQEEIGNLLNKKDLDRAIMSQLFVVEQSISEVQKKVKGINDKSLAEIRLDVSGLTENVNNFLDIEVPKYKKLVVDAEIRTNNRFEELENNVNTTLDGIGKLVDEKYDELTETLEGINENSLAGILEDFKILNKTVLNFRTEDIPKYKGFIVEAERKTESKLEEFNEKLDETVNDVVEKINSVETFNDEKLEQVESLQKRVTYELKTVAEHKEELLKKVTDLELEIIRNESHIQNQNEHLENIQEEFRNVISKLHIEKLEETNYELTKKVTYLENIFEKFNEKEILTENLLTEPPSTNNDDPLTPLNKNFVTLDQLKDHYKLFINRVQQQLATIGGGGETQLKYLDDIVGIATNASAYDGKFLKYDHSIGKFVFATAGGGAGSQTLDDTLQLGNTSSLGMSVGVVTATTVKTDNALYSVSIGDSTSSYAFEVDGGNARFVTGSQGDLSIIHANLISSVQSAANVQLALGSDSQEAIRIDLNKNVGIGTTNPTSKLVVQGDGYFTGVVTATNFYGNGFTLTGIAASEGSVYYVSPNGSDSYSGNTLQKPFASLSQALSVATSGDTIKLGSGTFTEVFPLTVPQGVSIRGMGLRSTLIQPTAGTKQNDGFLLNGDTTVEDLTIGNFFEPGYAFKFAPGKKSTSRSPYVQRVTVLNKGSVTSSTDPYGFDTPHAPPTSYKAGRGVLIDGSVVDPTTLEPAMLFNECTFICPNNIALEMTNGARTEWVNCFTYFADKGIYAHDGIVGLASVGYVRVKTSGFSGTTPTANDELYYLESNSQSGTYSQVGTALTITKVGHGLTVGDRIFADFTSGTATDGFYRVTEYVGVNTFAVTVVGSATTSGNVSYKEALGFGTVRTYTSSSGLSSITGKGEGLFALPSTRLGKTVTAFGNAQLSSTQEKFGTASLVLDGTGDYASVSSNTDFGFGTSDFTVETFVRLVGSATTQTIFDFRSASSSDSAIVVDVTNNDLIRVSYGSTAVITGVTTLTTGQWYHLALSRSSGSSKLFLGGVQEGSTYADSNNYGASKPLIIGANYSGSNGFNGYIDEVRISNVSRYTGTFTPTTSAFNSDGSDKLLLHFDGITGSTSFTDSSIPTQDIRWVRSGVGIATATKITLADYQQFGAEMRSIGSAVVFGNTGIRADGPGVGLRLFAFNFGHIGSGKDFSQDVSLVNQQEEVVTSNDANVYFVSIDQSGDFRVGDAFYVNQEEGTVNFGGQDFTLNSLSDLNVTDGSNTSTLTPTTLTVGNLQLSGNELTSTSGDITINPSGISSVTIEGDLTITGSVNFGYSPVNVVSLTSGNIVISGNDITTTSGGITINPTGINSVTVDSDLTVIGDTLFSKQLNVSGVSTVGSITIGNDITISNGIVSAISYSGDGSQLTGIAVTDNVVTNSLVVSGISTFAGITTVTGDTLFANQLNISGVSTVEGTSFTNQLNVSGVSTFTNTLNVSSIVGVQTFTTTNGTYSIFIGDVDRGYAFEVDGGNSRFVKGSQGDLSIIHSNLISSVQSAGNVQLALGSNGQEAVRINLNNNVGLGTTSPGSKLTVQGDGYFSGIVTATDYNSASDIKLKTNIEKIENPLDKILSIEGVKFTWKENGKNSFGVIAQQLEEVLPDLVSGKDVKTVNYNGLIGVLIECIKDQQEQINELRRLIDK